MLIHPLFVSDAAHYILIGYLVNDACALDALASLQPAETRRSFQSRLWNAQHARLVEIEVEQRRLDEKAKQGLAFHDAFVREVLKSIASFEKLANEQLDSTDHFATGDGKLLRNLDNLARRKVYWTSRLGSMDRYQKDVKESKRARADSCYRELHISIWVDTVQYNSDYWHALVTDRKENDWIQHQVSLLCMEKRAIKNHLLLWHRYPIYAAKYDIEYKDEKEMVAKCNARHQRRLLDRGGWKIGHDCGTILRNGKKCPNRSRKRTTGGVLQCCCGRYFTWRAQNVTTLDLQSFSIARKRPSGYVDEL